MRTIIFASLLQLGTSWKDAVVVYGGGSNVTASYVIDYRGQTVVQTQNSMPGLGRFYHAMAQLDDITYLIGGQEPINAISSKSKPRKEVFYKNNLENDWERLQGGDLSFARSRMATAVYNKRIWVCGGRGRAVFGSLIMCESFDGTKWRVEPPLIGTPEWSGRQGRDRFAMVTTSQGLMAIGGHNSYKKEPQRSTEIFTAQAGSWFPGPRMTRARFGHEAIVHKSAIYVFGGLIEKNAPILRLANFQSRWAEIGSMQNPMRLKFIAVKAGDEVFIYGGKCQTRTKTKNSSNESTFDTCDPMAEIFNLKSYNSEGVNFEIPGNLEATGSLYPNYISSNYSYVREPEIKARRFVDASLAAEFASFFDEIGEEIETIEVEIDNGIEEIEKPENRSSTMLQDFFPMHNEDIDYEKPENIYGDENYEYDYFSTVARSLNVTLFQRHDQNKDNLIEDIFNVNFDLPIAPLTEIVESLVKRNKVKEDFPIQSRSNLQCWKCNAASYQLCSDTDFEICASHRASCSIRVEKQNGQMIKVQAGCINPESCINLKGQNAANQSDPKETFLFNQCRPEYHRGPSVCRQCCSTAQCNYKLDPVTTEAWNKSME